MTEDILAPYRKTPLPAASGVVTRPGKGDYVAFTTKDKVPCLRIRRANFLTYAVGYNILLTNTYDDDKGQTILLYFSVMRVKIEGRNLQGLASAINYRTADCMVEFDPDRWVMPSDPKAPFIASIEVKMTGENSLPDELQQ